MAGIPFHAVPSPGKPTPETPHPHINNVSTYHRRLKQGLARFNGVAKRTCPTILGGGAPSKPGETNSNHEAGWAYAEPARHTSRECHGTQSLPQPRRNFLPEAVRGQRPKADGFERLGGGADQVRVRGGAGAVG